MQKKKERRVRSGRSRTLARVFKRNKWTIFTVRIMYKKRKRNARSIDQISYMYDFFFLHYYSTDWCDRIYHHLISKYIEIKALTNVCSMVSLHRRLDNTDKKRLPPALRRLIFYLPKHASSDTYDIYRKLRGLVIEVSIFVFEPL